MSNYLNNVSIDRKIVETILAEKWAITPEALKQICSIASGYGSPESVLTKNGERLEQTDRVEMRGSVAVIPVSGPLFRYANLFTEISGATSYQVFAKDFQSALENEAVESIVLDFDTPGGMANGMIETSDIIASGRGVKPVISYAGGDCASAGYGLACAADRVVVSKSAITGSIGVVSTYYDEEEDSIEIVSSNAPDKRPDVKTDEGRAVIQKTIDSLESVFISHVAQMRDVSIETVKSDFGRGGVFVGEQAVEAGLADSVGSLESVIAGLSGNTSEVFGMTTQSKANHSKPEITADYISAEHPAIAESFRAEGIASVDVQAAKEEGAKAERERIISVEAQSMPGHEDLIATLKFDGETTGEQAAVQVLQAEKGLNKSRAENITDIKDAPKAVADSPELEEKGEWESSADLRAEFNNDRELYDAYQAAAQNGQVKVLGGQ